MSRTIDYSVVLDEGLDTLDDAEASALKRLSSTGLSGPESLPTTDDGETFDGRLPGNLSSLPASQIGMYHSLMGQYANYVSWRKILAETTVKAARRKLELTKAAIRKTKTGSAPERVDATITDGRYNDAVADLLEAETYFELLQNIDEQARRNVKIVSRLIEVKKMQLEQSTRDGNIGREQIGSGRYGGRGGRGGGRGGLGGRR